MESMRQRIEVLITEKKQVGVNFAAGAGTKLISISGTIVAVGNDHFLINDIYGNSMMVPFSGIAYIEIKK